MRISIILAHLDPTSFNHAIARTVAEPLAENGLEVVCRDLYRENFNPFVL